MKTGVTNGPSPPGLDIDGVDMYKAQSRAIWDDRPLPYPGFPRDWVDQALEAMLLYEPDRVYLFGSVVRGEDTIQSDIDLLVAVDRVPLERWSEWRSALRFTARFFCPYRVNVFITDLEDLVRRRHIVTSPCKWVADEGRLIYDRREADEHSA